MEMNMGKYRKGSRLHIYKVFFEKKATIMRKKSLFQKVYFQKRF